MERGTIEESKLLSLSIADMLTKEKQRYEENCILEQKKDLEVGIKYDNNNKVYVQNFTSSYIIYVCI